MAQYLSVPTKGTHLLYWRKGARHERSNCFPSPRRGPIFSTANVTFIRNWDYRLSVPTKGTHLLYKKKKRLVGGVKLSVPTKGTHLLYCYYEHCDEPGYKLSVPTKGTHLLYVKLSNASSVYTATFRPHEGDPSSLPWFICYILKSWMAFRPHEGDPSSLRCKYVRYNEYLTAFRPHEGDPSSLQKQKSFQHQERHFPSPRRGPIFSTPSGLYTNFRIITAHFSW